MAILTSDDYPTIRAAIDVALDAAALPDSVIGLAIYAGAAELELLARAPNAASYTGTAAEHARNAAVYFAAARLVSALPQISGETVVGQHIYTRKLVDVTEQAAILRGYAAEEVAAALAAALPTPAPQPATPAVPVLFGVAGGRRGR